MMFAQTSGLETVILLSWKRGGQKSKIACANVNGKLSFNACGVRSSAVKSTEINTGIVSSCSVSQILYFIKLINPNL